MIIPPAKIYQNKRGNKDNKEGVKTGKHDQENKINQIYRSPGKSSLRDSFVRFLSTHISLKCIY